MRGFEKENLKKDFLSFKFIGNLNKMDLEKGLLKAVEAVRGGKKRKFSQSIDFIVNLKDFNPRSESFDLFVVFPNEVRKRKLCVFLERSFPAAEEVFDKVILQADFGKYDSKAMKKLAGEFDFFVAQAQVMPAIASSFGKVLGQRGKMPSPKAGSVVMNLDDKVLKEITSKLRKTVRLQAKDCSVKGIIGNEGMKDEDIVKNALIVYEAVVGALPKGKENVRGLLVKTSMGKPVRVENK